MGDTERHPTHREYVGKPEWFDVLGGRHFMLLFLLGLREHHRLLDLGCGSLRSGRLIIPYLAPGNYYGIDPNKWLIAAGLQHEVGQGTAELKQPHFAYNSDGDLGVFGTDFDFIHAHSVFTHASASFIRGVFRSASQVMHPRSIFVGTFVEGRQDYAGAAWTYPQTVSYTRDTLYGIVRDEGLAFLPIRWPHPSQTYFLATAPSFDLNSLFDAIQSAYGMELRGKPPHRLSGLARRLTERFAGLRSARHRRPG